MNDEENSNDGDDDDDDEDNIDNIGGDEGEKHSFGSLKGRRRSALDLRRNFFDDKNTYLLYLWDVLDEHDRLKCKAIRR